MAKLDKLDKLIALFTKKFTVLEKRMERGFAAVAADISDIKDKMATKDELASLKRELGERFDKVDDRLTAVESKVDGIQRSLDADRLKRTDLKLPRRVHDLEERVYGAGGSKHPKDLPL